MKITNFDDLHNLLNTYLHLYCECDRNGERFKFVMMTIAVSL